MPEPAARRPSSAGPSATPPDSSPAGCSSSTTSIVIALAAPLRAPLPRERARVGGADRQPLGRDRRHRRHRPAGGSSVSCGARTSTGSPWSSQGSRSSPSFLIVGLGFAFLVSSDALSRGDRPRPGADVGRDRIRASAGNARVHGIETVANFAAEAREPGRTLPRSLFVGIGARGGHVRRNRDRGRLCVSGPSRPGRPGRGRDRPRTDVAQGAAGRHRDSIRTTSCRASQSTSCEIFVGLSAA